MPAQFRCAPADHPRPYGETHGDVRGAIEHGFATGGGAVAGLRQLGIVALELAAGTVKLLSAHAREADITKYAKTRRTPTRWPSMPLSQKRF
jgi:hypothetical protein